MVNHMPPKLVGWVRFPVGSGQRLKKFVACPASRSAWWVQGITVTATDSATNAAFVAK